MALSQVDVVGLGLNATDTVMTVGEYPPMGGKQRVTALSTQVGGQMATAVVACRRLGLKARYIGKVGDDEAGRLQLASLRREGIDLSQVKVVRGAATQYGYILIDQPSGERTVLWDRDARLEVRPRELKPEDITTARLLHVDGCDVDAAVAAARWARRAGILVSADLDTPYKGIDRLLPYVDYLIASMHLLPVITGLTDPFKMLRYMAREYRVRTPGMTLGRDGAMVYHEGRFCYSPGFAVKTVDTTGAGDVFHGAFAYGMLEGWEMPRVLDFANAMAALNCMALGARGGIKRRADGERLMARDQRHVNPQYKTR